MPNRWQPPLIGGAFIGVLSGLPLVSLGNLCCCLWVIAGGVVAAYLLQQAHPEPITVGDGAAVGFMAGIVGAFVAVLVHVPFTLLLAPMQREIMRRFLANATDVPPEIQELAEQAGVGVIGVVVLFVLMLVVGMAFATAGGALGAVLFKGNRPQSSVPGVPPPPPPIESPPPLPPA